MQTYGEAWSKILATGKFGDERTPLSLKQRYKRIKDKEIKSAEKVADERSNPSSVLARPDNGSLRTSIKRGPDILDLTGEGAKKARRSDLPVSPIRSTNNISSTFKSPTEEIKDSEQQNLKEEIARLTAQLGEAETKLLSQEKSIMELLHERDKALHERDKALRERKTPSKYQTVLIRTLKDAGAVRVDSLST